MMSEVEIPSRSSAHSAVIRLMNDKRRYRRIEIRLGARFLTEDHREGAGHVINMSAGGVYIASDLSVRLREEVVVYVDAIGRMEGRVVRVTEEGFAVHFAATTLKRERIAEKLTWEWNRDQLHLGEERKYERVATHQPTQFFTSDGRELPCTVLDMSMSGLSIEVAARPPLGEIVTIGSMRGRVVRHHDRGIGIEFLTQYAAPPLTGRAS